MGQVEAKRRIMELKLGWSDYRTIWPCSSKKMQSTTATLRGVPGEDGGIILAIATTGGARHVRISGGAYKADGPTNAILVRDVVKRDF